MERLLKQALLVCACLFVLSVQAQANSLLDAEKIGSLVTLAEQGDAAAQYNLAEKYADGRIIPKDLKEALYWLEKAALAGVPNAQTSLGWAYMSDYLGLAPDYQLAMEWNLKAANQGFGEGSANIGLLYEKGWGVPVNYVEAANWYKKAISQGAKSGQAELKLAGLYDNGLGVQQNPTEAANLYRIAAEREDIEQAHQLNDQARVLMNQGKYQEMIALSQRALEIREKILGQNHADTAESLTQLGITYLRLKQSDKALPLLRRALEINDKVFGSENPVTAMSSNILAVLYKNTGRYDKALPLYQRNLAILEKTIGPEGQIISSSLYILADIYGIFGQYDKALLHYQRALTIDEKTLGAEHASIALTLLKMAGLYENIGQKDKTLQLLIRSLAINEKALGPNHTDTAESLTYLAMYYLNIGQIDKAVPLQQRALAIYEKTQLDAADASVYLPLIYLTRLSGQNDKNLSLLHQAYRAALIASEPDTLSAIQGYLGATYAGQGNPATAIFYLKSSVNTIQSTRAASHRLDRSLQESLLKKNEDVYQALADLLIDAGMLAEAQQVLTMLKEDEYFDFIRRDAQADARSTHMSFTDAERIYADRLELIGKKSAALADRRNALESMAKLGLTKEQEKERDRIRVELDSQAQQLVALLNELERKLPTAKKQTATATGEVELDRIRKTLAALGHGSALIQYVVAENRVLIFLTTPKSHLFRVSEIPAKSLNRKMIEFGQLLRNPSLDPRPLGQELYKLLITPVENDLKQAGAKTLMLSLDGSLRYLPMAALHDGKAYLAERFPLAIYTEVAKDKLREKPVDQWKVAGLGTTRKIGEFSALPAVQQEMDGIVRVKSGNLSKGILPGEVYLDESFTEARFRELTDQPFPVLHIASHFKFIPGTEAQSFLLLGDGEQLSLAEIRSGGWKFNSVDLMTLSACETGLGGGRDANGREIEGFGVLAQKQGAKGVLATLWSVADQSTALLMQTMYRARQEKRLTKAEALREAQLALITGNHKMPTETKVMSPINSTSTAPAYTTDPARPYAHPYYWAPFILMGNWL